MSRNEKKIRDDCAVLHVYVETLRWEPIGMAMEMCGYSGGWILNDFTPLGLSTKEAVAFIQEFGHTLEMVEEHEASEADLCDAASEAMKG